MKMQQRKSGLVVPLHEQPPPPQPPRGLMELHDPQRRQLAREGLLKLWDAMDLSKGSSGLRRLPGEPCPETRRTYRQFYELIGHLILGDDCPEKEELC